MKSLLATLILLLAANAQAGGTAAHSQILDVFPPSVVRMPAALQGETVISSTYTPSGSLWADGLDERQVFQVELKHKQGHYNSFALRVGKGGQIYSLRGPFGESVPPSWRAGSTRSPWNDEVWQFVAVCTKYNGLKATLKAGPLPDEVVRRFKECPYSTSFFVHNSGAYIPGDSAVRYFYCPLLASAVTPDNRSYRVLNWGLVPQLRTVHRSPLLYYFQTRDVGDGVIELTWVVHNFSVRDDIVFDHLNAPWGGTRVSSLPLHYISSPDGKLMDRKQLMRGNTINVRATGGWNLSCASESPDSPSLALVFGRDRHLEEELKRAAEGKPHCQFQPSLYRDWRAAEPLYKRAWRDWRTRPANTFRNYDVAVVIPKFRLAPGTTIWYRSFLVVNRKDRAIELAKSLVDSVDYGLVTFDPASTPTIPVSIQSKRPAFELFAWPVKGTMPLFLVRNTRTGRQVITTDPYIFVPKKKLDFGIPPDHPHYDYYSNAYGYSLDKSFSEWQRLLGFGYVKKPTSASWVKLSTVVPQSLFPQPDTYHLDLWVKKPAQ